MSSRGRTKPPEPWSPTRLTMFRWGHCYVCGGDGPDEEIAHRYVYPQMWNWTGVRHCRGCASAVDALVRGWYERTGHLPPECFRKGSPALRFARESAGHPERNGLYPCRLCPHAPEPVRLTDNGKIRVHVEWDDQHGAGWNKVVPVSSVAPFSRDAWPDAQSFMRCFDISVGRPDLTEVAVRRWQSAAESAFPPDETPGPPPTGPGPTERALS